MRYSDTLISVSVVIHFYDVFLVFLPNWTCSTQIRFFVLEVVKIKSHMSPIYQTLNIQYYLIFVRVQI
jgi:hypothetical protein